jgi:dipeptidyl aminopeptidase/acylaminoacyl peptidase
VASRVSGDRYALYEYDIQTRKLGKVIFQNANVDVGEPAGGPIYDPITTKLAGVYYVEDLWHIKYFDPAIDRIQQKLDATFQEAVIVRMVSWSADRTVLVAYAEGPREPGSFYVYDSKTDSAKGIGKLYPEIPKTELGQVELIKYPARDGTRLQGYLTMPPGKGSKNLPLVVMPHGGPEARDYARYDHRAQMLANRGYMVFQPNFRGSAGYGRAFTQAGYRQWGRRMQDDITDGVKTLIGDGSADKDRICIFGGSYGGYAALAGGAFTPELYKCVIAVAGVSDIPQMLEEMEDIVGKESAVYSYWVKQLGDPQKDLEQMKSVSPARHAQAFKAPVLLIHGTSDRIVSIDQSKVMNKVLKAAGKDVKFVEIKGEGHHFQNPGSDLRLLTELEQFLAAHIGN